MTFKFFEYRRQGLGATASAFWIITVRLDIGMLDTIKRWIYFKILELTILKGLYLSVIIYYKNFTISKNSSTKNTGFNLGYFREARQPLIKYSQ